MRRLRWLVPVGMTAAGVVTLFAGAVYGVASGVVPPYPDPTPEQYARWRYHDRVTDAIMLAGAAVVAGGLAVGMAGLVVGHLIRPAPPAPPAR